MFLMWHAPKISALLPASMPKQVYPLIDSMDFHLLITYDSKQMTV